MRNAVLRATLISYVALVAVPLASLAPGPTPPLIAGCALLGALVGTVATARIDPQKWLDTWPRVIAGFALPVVWLGLGLGIGPVPDGVASGPLFVGGFGIAAWPVAILTAVYCEQMERIEDATVELSFEARPASEVDERVANVAAIVLGLVTVVAVVVLALTGGFDDGLFLTWLPGMSVVLLLLHDQQDSREVQITDLGIVVHSTIHEWDTIASYSLDEEELSLSRPTWYHSTLRYDRDDIEDVEAVVDALSKRLPET